MAVIVRGKDARRIHLAHDLTRHLDRRENRENTPPTWSSGRKLAIAECLTSGRFRT